VAAIRAGAEASAEIDDLTVDGGALVEELGPV
jgi:hypothetical protein